MAPQEQRRDLADRRRVAVVVARQVSAAPAAVRDAVLAVVPWAEDPVETEEQQDEQDTRRQAQRRHPAGRERDGLLHLTNRNMHSVHVSSQSLRLNPPTKTMYFIVTN